MINKTSFMRTTMYTVAFSIVLASQVVFAQLYFPDDTTGSGPPKNTTAIYVAMVFHKLAGKVPDFNAWIRDRDVYKNAPDYQKANISKQLRKKLLEEFRLIVPNDDIRVPFEAELSDYVLKYGGFIIENFNYNTFLEEKYAGRNYAIVPKNIIDHQWLPVSDEAAMKIDSLRKQSEGGRTVKIIFDLEPRYADDELTLNYNGIKYYLIAAEVNDMLIYDAEGKVIWRKAKDTEETVDPIREELRTLFR